MLELDRLCCYTIRRDSGMALALVHFYSPIKLLGMIQISASSVVVRSKQFGSDHSVLESKRV